MHTLAAPFYSAHTSVFTPVFCLHPCSAHPVFWTPLPSHMNSALSCLRSNILHTPAYIPVFNTQLPMHLHVFASTNLTILLLIHTCLHPCICTSAPVFRTQLPTPVFFPTYLPPCILYLPAHIPAFSICTPSSFLFFLHN